MAEYLVCGITRKGSSKRSFQRVVEAESEKLARENVLSLFGSNAGIKRTAIKIESVEKL